MSCFPCFSSKVKPEDGHDDSLLKQRLEEATRRISELECKLTSSSDRNQELEGKKKLTNISNVEQQRISELEA